MDLPELVQILCQYPALTTYFSLDSLVVFINLLQILKPTLSLQQSSQDTDPPDGLPLNVVQFLAQALSIPDDVVLFAWAALKQIAWSNPPIALVDAVRTSPLLYIKLFLVHGLSRGLALHHFLPPTRVCIDPACMKDTEDPQQRELSEPKTHPVTVFTRDVGAIPGFTTSLYCRNCHTRYHSNYYIHDKAMKRTYYFATPDFVQIAQHVLMSASLCEHFANMMVFSWTSSTNCARIYNESITNAEIQAILPPVHAKNLSMTVDDVLNGFFLFSLLLDRQERMERGDYAEPLQLENDAPSQAERLRPALEARNYLMVGPGQEAWSHVCNLCAWVSDDHGTILLGVLEATGGLENRQNRHLLAKMPT
ncbi:hypothetical protein HGRIS_013649 [Hohenbuehelia grisea]|uniref:CxC5 like cysteine cluster associated with KDZ domain-containing protein n=1 Tax=Hohenbuehelia grisea TaxID=104357 RepID=A0ABR3IW76_9AGAR